MTDANERQDNEGFKFGGTAPDNIHVKTSAYDSIGNSVAIDSATNATITIEYEHHEIHSGSHYFLCDTQTFANAEVVDFTNVTPNTTEWLHLTFLFQGTGGLSFEILEMGLSYTAYAKALTTVVLPTPFAP